MTEKYDVIVVGGGHAGCEAAAAAANLGSRTLLITMDMGKFAQMSCNPAMGGVAKGQIIREIDALGGYSGIVSDYSAIQFRMLNRSKGPAMWSPRTQNDRQLFTIKWREMLEQTPNLDFWQDSVTALINDGQTITGVKTSLGINFNSTCVILTSGTFMNGLIHVGKKILGGGRMGEKASTGITAQLETFGFESGRMKTGTPPRIDGSSLDYTKMEEQHGDINPQTFSFLSSNVLKNQASCHITYTNQTVHDIIGSSISQSPLYNGQISGIGPRYCPSVEDKVQRFADKDRHQIFVEPEGWNTKEVYVNGFSTSLPLDVQTEAIRHIPGFKNAKMFRPGYAIEYDYFPPTQLSLSLETKLLSGLFFAGQINGTTGYEEAASQGLIAGINAHQKCSEKEPLILSRKDAYIGVLIDDLITKGTEEPYRMFTSRAEYRINIRHMTADERLTPLSFNLGLAHKQRIKKLDKKLLQKTQYSKLLSKTSIQPDEANPVLESISSRPIQQAVKATSLITRPNISATLINEMSPMISHFCQTQNISKEAIESAEIEIKYSGYILREQEQAEKMLNMDRMKIPLKFKYESLKSISNESKEKLLRVNPDNLGQASRIPGVKPSDISILMVAIDTHVSHET
ncbi:tRNA uridine-5-carboxymethylaminomethyl(34) synthesis enzyme MnmG [bacterium]|jgi:tRNA uridine 5-carboxymethylaminomethyl modification enzyme|nr:tRNA uridine-5-carboxymethylaminomethyl(34) synthesis enzyme MnmG [bacterium]MDC1221360.1 tRNA uridine-5-carboxymethylaminomethyl(34) synthesis enzyme MnmG [Salibacteraceae bacterium]